MTLTRDEVVARNALKHLEVEIMEPQKTTNYGRTREVTPELDATKHLEVAIPRLCTAAEIDALPYCEQKRPILHRSNHGTG